MNLLGRSFRWVSTVWVLVAIGCAPAELAPPESGQTPIECVAVAPSGAPPPTPTPAPPTMSPVVINRSVCAGVAELVVIAPQVVRPGEIVEVDTTLENRSPGDLEISYRLELLESGIGPDRILATVDAPARLVVAGTVDEPELRITIPPDTRSGDYYLIVSTNLLLQRGSGFEPFGSVRRLQVGK